MATTETDREQGDSTIDSHVDDHAGGLRFHLLRLISLAIIVVLIVGGSVVAIDRWIVPSRQDLIATWRSKERHDESWADWYANRPPRTIKPIPHFAEYQPGPWALEFNGHDSFVYFADPGPIPTAVTLEVVTTLRLAKSGTLLCWYHEDEMVALGLNTNGELGLVRIRDQTDGSARWIRPMIGIALAEPLLDEPLHIVAQWDGDDYQMFINGQSQLLRPEYGGLVHGASNGVFVGGVPPMEIDESAHASPFAAALIHEVRITSGLGYHDSFSPPTRLTRAVTEAAQPVLLLGDFREKAEQNSLADPLILSRTIRNANWVRQP